MHERKNWQTLLRLGFSSAPAGRAPFYTTGTFSTTGVGWCGGVPHQPSPPPLDPPPKKDWAKFSFGRLANQEASLAFGAN